MLGEQRTILVTFAGRRDRMQLLTRYVGAAIERGLIDEWHVWDFARNAEDSGWLRERFPVTQATPNNSLEYYRSPRRLELQEAQANLRLRVRATNDVHLGLRRLSGEGPDYEIVLGGWNNMASAIRKFDSRDALRDVASRDRHPAPVVVRSTPGLLPEFGFSGIELEIGEQGLRVRVAGESVLRDPEPISRGAFEVLYRTGFGSNGDWRLAEFAACSERRFVVGPEAHFPPDAMFYTRAYQYYNANAAEYSEAVILKCDDDIVYFDLDKLEEFVSFRRSHDEFLLVSANVVNNGVCAFFQQRSGVIPHEDDAFELPPDGLCGTLWSDGAKAERLHRLFLNRPTRFTAVDGDPVAWNQRISINFIALLGKDLGFIPDIMVDDEHDLCYGVRKRAKKLNCIFPRFVASHLSFWKQDANMSVQEIIGGYDALARFELAKGIGALPEYERPRRAAL
jgi:hypothetical protein